MLAGEPLQMELPGWAACNDHLLIIHNIYHHGVGSAIEIRQTKRAPAFHACIGTVQKQLHAMVIRQVWSQ